MLQHDLLRNNGADELSRNSVIHMKKRSIESHDYCARASANDPKLSDRDPEARVCANRREAKARHVLGFMAGAHAVTEPVELRAALR